MCATLPLTTYAGAYARWTKEQEDELLQFVESRPDESHSISSTLWKDAAMSEILEGRTPTACFSHWFGIRVRHTPVQIMKLAAKAETVTAEHGSEAGRYPGSHARQEGCRAPQVDPDARGRRN